MPFHGEIEVDENYFGGRRKGMRGKGAAGKIPVFGLLKRGGKAFAKVIPNAKSKTLMGIMQEKVVPDSIIYRDTFPAYNVLDVSKFKHYRINHSKLFADKKNYINGIENFWNQAKRRMLSACRVFTLAESLGGVESLIEHPAIMTHASVPQAQRERLGIKDGLIRLSVGIEDADDLIDDLSTALATT